MPQVKTQAIYITVYVTGGDKRTGFKSGEMQTVLEEMFYQIKKKTQYSFKSFI